MASRVRQKEYIGTNVYEAAKERVRYLFDNFDKVVVSFSGGKDSTAVLNVAMEVARERKQLPLDVIFIDEETVAPPTIEYVERVAKMPEVNMHWVCMEFKHRNACSNVEAYYYTWDKTKKDVWVREMPKGAITEHPRFTMGLSYQEFIKYYFDTTHGKVAMVTGIRTQESLRRYQVIAKKRDDCYIQFNCEGKSNSYTAHPIYDWSSHDVWLLVARNSLDYNRVYDVFNKTKLYQNYLGQRVCHPFGEESLRGIDMIQTCFPDFWEKLLVRVGGVGSAGRYGNTSLYSNAILKPEDMTYKQYLNVVLDSYSPKWKNLVKSIINSYMKMHKSKTKDPIPDSGKHETTSVSWQFLCRVAIRGDFKKRQSTNKTYTNTEEYHKKRKVKEKYGN